MKNLFAVLLAMAPFAAQASSTVMECRGSSSAFTLEIWGNQVLGQYEHRFEIEPVSTEPARVTSLYDLLFLKARIGGVSCSLEPRSVFPGDAYLTCETVSEVKTGTFYCN